MVKYRLVLIYKHSDANQIISDVADRIETVFELMRAYMHCYNKKDIVCIYAYTETNEKINKYLCDKKYNITRCHYE